MAGRAVELAVAYLSVIPEVRGVAPAVRRGLAGVDTEARNAGRQFGSVFSRSASEATNVTALGKKTADAAGNAARASRDLTAARKAEKDSAQSLAVAEARLNELRGKSTTRTSQILAAEQRVDRARETSAQSQGRLAQAYDREFVAKGKAAAASRAHATATTQASGQVARAGGVFNRFGLELNQSQAKIEANRAAMAALAGPTGAGALAGMGATLKTGLAAGLGAVLASSVKLEASYSQTMNLVRSATGVGADEMARMDALAIKLGQDTSFSANEAASAMLALAKAGVKPATIETGALSATLLQAAASGDDLESSANAIGNALNMFSLKGTDAAKVAAAFAGGANASTAEVKDLTLGLSQVGPGAASMGMSINEVVGTLAAFNNAGVRGQDAGTSLKTMLASLEPQTKAASTAMASLGLYSKETGSAFFDSNGEMKSATEIAGLLQNATKGLSDQERSYALNKIFGSDASRAANILAKEGAAGLGKYIAATQNASAAQDMANARMQGTAGALERLSGSWETLRLSIGKALAPAVQVGATLLAGAMGVLGDNLNVLLPVFATLAAVIGAYKLGVAGAAAYTQLLAFWTARQTVAQYALNTAMRLSTVGLIVAGVAALIAGFILLYNKSQTVRDVIAAVGRAFAVAGEAIGGGFSAAVSVASAAWGALTDAVSRGWSWLQANVFAPIVNVLSGPLSTAWGAVSGAAVAAWGQITSAVSTAWASISGVFTAFVTVVRDVLGVAVSWFWTQIVRPVFSAVGSFIRSIWVGVIQPTFVVFRDFVVALGATIVAFWNEKVQPAFAAVGAFIKSVWENVVKVAFTALVGFVRGVLAPAVLWLWANVFKPVFTFVGDVISTIWNSVVRPVFAALVAFVRFILGPTVMWLWQGVVLPAFRGIGVIIGVVWTNIVLPVFKAFVTFMRDVLAVTLRWLWGVVTTVFKAIGAAIAAAWNYVIRPVFNLLVAFVKNVLGPALQWLWNNVVRPVFAFIGSAIKSTWERVIKPALTAFGAAVSYLPKVFAAAKTGISKAWDQIKKAALTPVNFVIDVVINGLIDKVNSIGGVFGLFQGANAIRRLPIIKAYAGGPVPGWSPNDTADNIPAMLTAEEHVIRRRSARRMRRRHPGVLEYINATGSLPGYANGGQVSGYAKGGMVYQSLIAWVRKNIPGLAITSTYRPGSITASGNRSFHSMGMAIDIGPSMGAFNKILATFGSRIAELIYSPAGGRQVKNGRPYYYQGAVRAQHFCVPTDVRILTRRGWLTHSELRQGDETLGFDADTGLTRWTRITDVNVFDDASVYEAGNNHGWTVRATADHRWLTQSSNGELGWTTTTGANGPSWLVAAPMADGPGLPISDEEAELLGWLMTDGSQWSAVETCTFEGCGNPARPRGLCGSHSRQAKNGSVSHSLRPYPRGATVDTSLFVWQTKPEGVTRLEELLDGRANWNGKGFRLFDAYAADLLARAGVGHIKSPDDMLAAILAMSARQRQFMLAGVIGGDGSKANPKATDPVTDVLAGEANQWKVYQDAGPLLDVMSTLVSLCGYRPRTIRRHFTDGLKRNGINMMLTITRPRVHTGRRTPAPIGRMPVWCPTTELGTWTAQDGDVIYLTGNSHVHWAMRTPVGDVPPGSMDGMPLDGSGGIDVFGPVRAAVQALIDRVPGANTVFGKIVRAFPAKLLAGVGTWIGEKASALVGKIIGGDPKLDASNEVRSTVQAVAAKRNWGAGPNWEALQYIIGRESSWNTNARNPSSGAYGLGQFLPSTWRQYVGGGFTSSPSVQAEALMRYISDRYGTPIKARAFWQKHHWYGEGGEVEPVNVAQYDAGGILRPGLTLARNDTGKPETIRTFEQERALQAGGGTNITINGIRYDSIGEFASELNFALARAAGRSRYAGVA